MEGFFSPHQLPIESHNDLIWMGHFFLKNSQTGWIAVHSGRLLNQYVSEKIKTPSSVTPLLVSEPYAAKGVSKDKIIKMSEAGFEIDYLNPETLVLRSIPDWFNGFPLQEIVQKLLSGLALTDLAIRKEDWSQSLWEEMLLSIPESELKSHKISFPLESILLDKFK
jgi:DNA mismatch repair ATPase MutL